MRIGIIGGSGFIGGYLVKSLLARNHDLSLLVRPNNSFRTNDDDRCHLVRGSVDDLAAISETVAHCDVVIYCAGILREDKSSGATFEAVQYRGVVATVDAAVAANVQHLVLLSANGVDLARTPYQKTKVQAEQYLKHSGVPYTIFRPSVVFGDPRGKMEIATQLHRDMIRPPFPAIGFYTGLRPATGGVLFSPVHVQDLTDAVVRCIHDPATLNSDYDIGGPERLSWTEMLQRIARTVGKRKIILPMPIALMRVAATFLDWIPAFPVTRDQLTMLAAGNTAPDDGLRTLIEREPIMFCEESLDYLIA